MIRKILAAAAVLASLAGLTFQAYAGPNRTDKSYIQSIDGNDVVISSRGAIIQRGSFADTNKLSTTTVNGSITATDDVTATDDLVVGDSATVNGSFNMGSTSRFIRNGTALTSISSTTQLTGAYPWTVMSSTGNNVVMQSLPTIATTTVPNGTEILLMGASDTNTVTLKDNDNLAGTLFKFPGNMDVTLGLHDSVLVKLSSGFWVAISTPINN